MSDQELINVDSLCRICLTQSANMVFLSDETYLKHDNNQVPIIQILNRFLKVEVSQNKNYPPKICAICVSLLKIAYDFKMQYEISEKVLLEMLGNSEIEQTVVEPDNVKDHYEEEASDNFRDQYKKKHKQQSAVEILVNGNVYSLNDLLIIENESEDTDDFSAFLNNLGTEISAEFINKRNYKFQLRMNPEEITVVDNGVIDNFVEDDSAIQSTNASCEDNIDVSMLEGNRSDSVHTNFEQEQSETGTENIDLPMLLYKCDECKKVFNTKSKLSGHKYRAHRNEILRIECVICGHISHSKSAANHHRYKHNGRQHKCPVCGKMFYTKSHMRCHANAHYRKQKYLCNVCGKEFIYSNALTYHLRLHSGEKNYLCRFCGQTFTMDSALTRHLRVHTGAKPYKCSFCGRAFASNSEVKCHEMGHTGFRPYHCKYCNKGYTKTHNLKMHLLSHTGPHACDLCSKTFIEMNFLKTHLKIAHKMGDENPD